MNGNSEMRNLKVKPGSGMNTLTLRRKSGENLSFFSQILGVTRALLLQDLNLSDISEEANKFRRIFKCTGFG